MDKETFSNKVVFGFWVYLMTDLLMFGVLFAAYLVLKDSTFGGPGANELFDLRSALSETLILLSSSFSAGLGLLAGLRNDRRQFITWSFVTFFLGLTFLLIEISEFRNLILDGNSWSRSSFLSAFFTLVGTHGLHIAAGLFWLSLLIISVFRKGLSESNVRKITLFSLFWHFLDIVWVFIFTIVYLLA
jgi:cytochrome o ubiquinol oxidase subunit 3